MSFYVRRPSWMDYAAVACFTVTAVIATVQLGGWLGGSLALASAAIVAGRLEGLHRERRSFAVIVALLGASTTDASSVRGVLPLSLFQRGQGTTSVQISARSGGAK